MCVCVCVCEQEQVSGGTTSTILRNLLSDTPYTVTVVPVYPEGEGLRQSDDGKTRKSSTVLAASDQIHLHLTLVHQPRCSSTVQISLESHHQTITSGLRESCIKKIKCRNLFHLCSQKDITQEPLKVCGLNWARLTSLLTNWSKHTLNRPEGTCE